MEKQFSGIKPVQKELLHAKIADAIMEFIQTNHLHSGEKLPAERVLAEQFATSRNSVREALRVLENEQIIEVRPGSGAFIKEHSESNSFYLKLWKVNYIELIEVKEIFELVVVQSLCGKLTAEQLDGLEQSVILMEEVAKQNEFSHEADIHFHEGLRQLCPNRMVSQLLENIIESLHFYWKMLRGEEANWLSTLPYHRDLLEALKQNNLPAAEQSVREICAIDKATTEWLQKNCAQSAEKTRPDGTPAATRCMANENESV